MYFSDLALEPVPKRSPAAKINKALFSQLIIIDLGLCIAVMRSQVSELVKFVV